MRGNSPSGLGNGDRHVDDVVGVEVMVCEGVAGMGEVLQVPERTMSCICLMNKNYD